MIKKKITLLILSASIGTGVLFARLPFLPPSRIKAEQWKTELRWPTELVGKIVLAQNSHKNKLTAVRRKLRKEEDDFSALLEEKDTATSEIEVFVNNMLELEKSRLENDLEFIMTMKKILRPDQQTELMEKMTGKKKRGFESEEE